MRLLLIGPPGSGKGTQAVRIAEHFGIAHISSGELLRRHVADRTSIGRAIEEYVNRGDLVPDGVVMDLLRKPVTAASQAGGYVLDGFPRTVEQAEAAYLVAKALGASVRIAVHLDVDRDELVRRVLARGRETGRADDTEDVINHRLQVFEERTRPLLHYYARREELITVNGARPVEEVSWSVIVQLQRIQRQLNK
jgi:adenylate kinase